MLKDTPTSPLADDTPVTINIAPPISVGFSADGSLLIRCQATAATRPDLPLQLRCDAVAARRLLEAFTIAAKDGWTLSGTQGAHTLNS